MNNGDLNTNVVDNNINSNEVPTMVQNNTNNVTNTPTMVNGNTGVVESPIASGEAPTQDNSTSNPTPEVVATEPSAAPVQPTAVDPNTSVTGNGDGTNNAPKPGAEYKPPSKGKLVLLVLFFIFMIAFIIFLPDISSYISMYKAGKLNQEAQKITDGKLTCTLDTNTTNLDKNYRLVFTFAANKLNALNYSLTTKGDATQDEKTLDDLASKCKILADYSKKINGVSVKCDYSDGKLVESQTFDYTTISEDDIDSVYAEAGGTNPQYKNGQDMDTIEKNMNASGYTCERSSN